MTAVPCKHPGCMAHVTHPCEGCSRQWTETSLSDHSAVLMEGQLRDAAVIIGALMRRLGMPEVLLTEAELVAAPRASEVWFEKDNSGLVRTIRIKQERRNAQAKAGAVHPR